mmetsp:Transcript_8425/g.31076  ORF Transcript_8425/g.31076 Transcript_8425/m.31076 type:complete len:234 (+) Transcript_8425:606-1307(+)
MSVCTTMGSSRLPPMSTKATVARISRAMRATSSGSCRQSTLRRSSAPAAARACSSPSSSAGMSPRPRRRSRSRRRATASMDAETSRPTTCPPAARSTCCCSTRVQSPCAAPISSTRSPAATCERARRRYSAVVLQSTTRPHATSPAAAAAAPAAAAAAATAVVAVARPSASASSCGAGARSMRERFTRRSLPSRHMRTRSRCCDASSAPGAVSAVPRSRARLESRALLQCTKT